MPFFGSVASRSFAAARSRSSNTSTSSASFVGATRNTVPCATPARSAMSFVVVRSKPSSAKSALAAARISRRVSTRCCSRRPGP